MLDDMGLTGSVALITGAARGQGRSHAVSLARAGADIAVTDVAGDVATVPYDLGTEQDLSQTVELVEREGRRCLAAKIDVRDLSALSAFADQVGEQLGRLDIVVGNAGIYSFAESTWELTEEQWNVMLDVNLTGVWHTCKASIPVILRSGRGGSIVLISSVNGLVGVPGTAHYCAAKHGLVGLMRTLAIELAPHNVRVNTLHPTAVNTTMAVNSATEMALAEAQRHGKDMTNLLPVELMEPHDVSSALMWLVSPAARYVTGITLPIDAGFTVK
jgi:SDR family mycofactocin-dependent oxidoreductase